MNPKVKLEAATRQRPRTLLAALGLGAALTLGACAPPPEEPSESTSLDSFGYAVPSVLETSNTGTLEGASNGALLLSTRLYPGVYIPGPSGQMIPNSDLMQHQVLPGANRQVIYTIADDATYSDGTPVTCTDYLLSYKAGVLEALFGSHLPLTQQVERMDCNPGSKRFTVVFQEGKGDRWRQLFGPGSVLPAHAIAGKAGMSTGELHTALMDENWEALAEPARIWREGFRLSEFDPELQVSSGPFKIESVGERGEVTLVANDTFYGDPPALDRLVVWPEDVAKTELVEQGALRVAEADTYDWVDRDDPMNPYEIEQSVGQLTETLTLGNAGVFYSWDARQAFAACVDQRAVAAASSAVSGIEVPPVATHVASHDDPVARQLTEVTEPHLETNPTVAAPYAGMTVRIGYQGPDERKAAMVEAIRDSCEPMGITVLDAAAEGSTLADLNRTLTGQWGEEIHREGAIDAVLREVDPQMEYAEVAPDVGDVPGLREAEEQLWEQVPAIPLAAQPRTFVIDGDVGNVVVYTGLSGIGWNMDRWRYDGPERQEEE